MGHTLKIAPVVGGMNWVAQGCWFRMCVHLEYAQGVRLNLERSAQIAAPLLAYSLSEGIESAQVLQQ